MPARRRARPTIPLLALLVVGCASGGPAESLQPSALPSAGESTIPAAGLPPGCEPIELRDTTGALVVLDGQWIEVASPDTGELMTWWIFTQGTCVWGAGQVDEAIAGGTTATPDDVQSLNGQIGSDFTITGALLWLGPLPPGAGGNPTRFAPLRMRIDLDEPGRILLREDREPGVRGPHCPDPLSFCPEPLVLERAD
jgi:hypothetical protein